MTNQIINVGVAANTKTGDQLRVAFQKAVANFAELYGALPLSVNEYAADSTGTIDSTVAIQATINAATALNPAVYLPAGNFKFTALTMPTLAGFVFFGAGAATTLVQTGSGITWPSTGTAICGNYGGYIKNLAFDATAGTSHTINTSFASGVTLQDLTCGNLAATFDFLHIDGNAASTGDKYSHDVRVTGLQVSSTTAGNAGIGYGPYASDTSFDRFTMNGNSATSYGAYAANGAQYVSGSNSRIYNTTVNDFFLQAGATTALGYVFTNITFDIVSSGTGDNVVLNNARSPVINACRFEAVSATHNALTLTNTIGTTISATIFNGKTGANYLINETGTSDYTVVLGGDAPTLANFTQPYFNFIGSHSYSKSFISITPFGLQQSFIGSTSAVVPTNTTVYLGPNGAQAAALSSTFMIPLASGMNVTGAAIAWDVAPGAAQSFTATLYANGTAVTAAAGSANPFVGAGTGVFSGTIAVAPGTAQALAQYNLLYLKFVTSNGAATPNVRYAINAFG